MIRLLRGLPRLPVCQICAADPILARTLITPQATWQPGVNHNPPHDHTNRPRVIYHSASVLLCSFIVCLYVFWAILNPFFVVERRPRCPAHWPPHPRSTNRSKAPAHGFTKCHPPRQYVRGPLHRLPQSSHRFRGPRPTPTRRRLCPSPAPSTSLYLRLHHPLTPS